MNEEQQAQTLRRWLEAGARGDPPAGLDPEVLEAVYALRPDLAPAPRVSIDDILAGVTSGPFATPQAPAEGGEVVPFPVGPARPEVAPDLLDVPEPANRGWRRGAGALVGLLAAAAAGLLVFTPGSDLSPTSGAKLEQGIAAGEASAPAEDRGLMDYVSRSARSREADVASSRARPPEEPAEERKEALKARKDAPAAASTYGDDAVVDLEQTDERDAPGKAKGVSPDELDLQRQTALPEPSQTAAPAVQVLRGAAANTFDEGADGDVADGFAGAMDEAEPAAEEAEVDALLEDAPAGRKQEAAAAPPPPAAKPMAPPAKRDARTEAEAAGAPAPAPDVDGLRAVAARVANTDPRAAATSLEPLIVAPAATGQAIAREATDYALRAKDWSLAIRLGERGIGLAPGTAVAATLRSWVEAARAMRDRGDARALEALGYVE